jgi:hypothetical protein
MNAARTLTFSVRDAQARTDTEKSRYMKAAAMMEITPVDRTVMEPNTSGATARTRRLRNARINNVAGRLNTAHLITMRVGVSPDQAGILRLSVRTGVSVAVHASNPPTTASTTK